MVIIYKSKAYNTMNIGDAIKEREKMLNKGSENVCIIDAYLNGGKYGEYFVAKVKEEGGSTDG